MHHKILHLALAISLAIATDGAAQTHCDTACDQIGTSYAVDPSNMQRIEASVRHDFAQNHTDSTVAAISWPTTTEARPACHRSRFFPRVRTWLVTRAKIVPRCH